MPDGDYPQSPLKPLHSEKDLIGSKLSVFERMRTDTIIRSLALGQAHCLKARPDGTMLDGHHRIHVLKARGEDVDQLPREILRPDSA